MWGLSVLWDGFAVVPFILLSVTLSAGQFFEFGQRLLRFRACGVVGVEVTVMNAVVSADNHPARQGQLPTVVAIEAFKINTKLSIELS